MTRTRYRTLALGLLVACAVAIVPACGGGGGGGSPTASTPPPAPPAPPPPAPTPDAMASYRVTFDATWSATTHPTNFPSNPHFSGLIGATHLEDTRFWEGGGIASDGIKAMAETGSKSPLDSEISQSISAGQAETTLSGGGIGRSPGTVRLDFEATVDHPFVTLVSMIAPSPDWFVGVSALSLMEDGDWAQRIDVELFAYDAGTDGGANYTSGNKPLNPRVPIEMIDKQPFRVDGEIRSLGTFTFRRLD